MSEVIAVFDPHASLELDGHLRDAAHLPLGRVHCPIPAGARRLEGLANAVLSGLGKRTTVTDLNRNQTVKWKLTRAWVEGEQVTDLFLSSAENLQERLPEAIRELAGSICPGRLWFIYSHRRAERQLAGTPTLDSSPDDFAKQFQNGALEAPPAAPVAFPRAPEEEFVRFRATAHRELEATEFNVVKQTWLAAHTSMLDWIDNQATLDENSIGAQIGAAVMTCRDFHEAVVTIRAIQPALLRRDYLLKANLPRLAERTKLASPADLEGGVADKLRWYSGPHRPAAAVIRILALDSVLDDVANLTEDDIATDGSVIQISGLEIPVPVPAQGILRSQHLARQALNDIASNRYLLYKAGGTTKAPSRYVIHKWLREVTVEGSVPLVGHYTEGKQRNNRTLMQRQGLSLQRL